MKNNDKTKKIIAFLDKEYPPNHSFIDGFLSTELANEKDIKIYLIVSGNKDTVCRYKSALCLPVLFRRINIYRFLNFFKVITLIKILINRKKEEKIVLFVRNEPIYLFACTFFRDPNISLIFQSSFPHENISGNIVKRFIGKLIYKISASHVNSLLGVSKKGILRLNKLMPNVKKSTYIPLLSDFILEKKDDDFDIVGETVKFIYVGDHGEARKLEVVLSGIVKAYNKGLKAKFKFVGGESKHIKKFQAIPGVIDLENKGLLTFIKKVPRNRIWNEMIECDVGISFIPPDNHYKEASPTKLTEYMGVGLAVVATLGIDLQEEFVRKSDVGLLCEWSDEKISNCLLDISSNKTRLIQMKKSGYHYVKEEMNYRKYIDTFKKLI